MENKGFVSSNLVVTLSKVQSELKAPKGQFNKFGNFSYRSCEDIIEAVKPILAKYSLILNINDEVVLIGDRFYIKATAKITDGVDEVSATAYAREPNEQKGMNESQITGSTSSYARKYALNGLLAIDDNKDADTMEYQKQQKLNHNEKKEEMITEEQVKLIHVLFGKIEKSEKQIFKNFENSVAKLNVYKKFKVKTSKDLTKAKAKELIDLLNSKLV